MKQEGLGHNSVYGNGKVRRTYLINFDNSIFSEIQEFVQHDSQFFGDSLIILGCEGGFSRCIPKQNSILFSPEEACNSCKKSQLTPNNDGKKIDFPLEYMKSRTLPTAVLIFLESGEKSIEAFRNFEYEGVSIFRLAAFDLVSLARILSTKDLFSSENRELKERLVDVCNLIHWLKESIHFDDSSMLLACNGNYMLNGVCREFASIKGSKFFSIEMEPLKNSGYIKFKYFANRDAFDSKIRNWENFLGYRFKRYHFSNVLKQFENRFKGAAHNSYVSKNDSIITLNRVKELKSKTKSVRTVFLSSSEELLSHAIAFDVDFSYEQYVNHQTKFIKFILSEVRNFPDIGVVIRCHPRQGVSKKSQIISEEYEIIEALIRSYQLPENLIFIEPNDSLSSYKLISLSDTVSVFWSTIALESLLLGIPTVTLSPEIEYWPLKDLTNYQFESSEVAWGSFFSLNCQAGIPNDSRIIEWYERSFNGNWYQTCIPILTSSTLFNPKNLLWRIVDHFELRSRLIQMWIRAFPTNKAQNESYTGRKRWAFSENCSRSLSYLELKRWRQHWHKQLQGINLEIE